MKITFVFGKGIDGCGVTRGALIFEKWLVSQGYDTSVVTINNGTAMKRSQSTQFIGKLFTAKFTDEDISDEIVNEVNSADIAIFHSYPVRKYGPVIAERFRRFVEKLRDPIIVMHDHGVTANTINAIPQAGEIFSYADVLVAQSKEGLTKQAFTEFDPSLVDRIVENQIWIQPDLLDEYDLPLDQRRKVLNYTGRSSPIKQIGLVCKVIPLILDQGWHGELIGAERSINAVSTHSGEGACYQPLYQPLIQCWCQNKSGIAIRMGGEFLPADHPDPPIYAIDRYAYSDGMSRLGSSVASWAGYRLKDPAEYGSRMEYTQIEAGLLTVPIFNKHFAEEAYSSEGKLWKEYDCFLTADIDSHEQLAEDLVRLWDSPSEWNDRHQCGRDILSDLFNIDNLAPQFLTDILSLGKKPDGPRGLELMHWWPEAAQRRADGETIMTSANGLTSQRKLILVDNKQKEIK